ncbi:ribosomal protein S18 acetylase RimI-like enzyme [Arcanobacterium pluranimalium]|uniref:GNAT family N-acetyltransferase n=1 Tax=Arcanobacterium pluranimalium TaxID=108028 RepID=UPI00195E2A8F|nr:DUF4081 domain-containing GNAT family N-acetyltransferase [Arcanobacterium pluranimalium]MBM7825646.1 ribosomal protein S18 acetylase RimI-like enzyme [Arcanobacterium pluranimalium]
MRLWHRARNGQIARLSRHFYSQAAAILERDPVSSIFLRSAWEERSFRNGHFLAYRDDAGALSSLCWQGANLAPWGFDSNGLDQLAKYLSKETIFANSIVGPADQVMGLWEKIKWRFPTPRDVRPHQLSMVFQGVDSRFAIGAGSSWSVKNSSKATVRRAQITDFDIVYPASVAMFIEEVGYDPSTAGDVYPQRVKQLLRQGRTFVQIGRDPFGLPRVEFKADIGILAGGVAQLQGVWTAPDLRGCGIATSALTQVLGMIGQDMASTISLYVNDYNLGAIRVYEKIGFATVGEFATVLL